MGNPIFRFTLTHAVAGSIRTSEVAGWMESKLVLDRDEEYSSLIERFEGAFDFYGSNGVDNGGWPWIKNLEKIYGPDVEIQQLIEVSFNSGVDYETIFDGLLDVSLVTESPDNQAEIPTIRNSFWANFINRKSTPVDLQALTDLDEAEITPVSTANIHLSPQKLQQKYIGQSEQGDPWFPCKVILTSARWEFDTGYDYGILDFENEVLTEIEEKFHYPMVESPTFPFEMFQMQYAGDYTFQIYITLWGIIEFSSPPAGVDVYFQINNPGTPILLTRTDNPGAMDGDGCPIAGGSSFEYTGAHTLNAGDQVFLYIKTDGVYFGGYSVFMPLFSVQPSYMYVTAQTVYPETRANGMLIHDAGAAIVNSYGLGEENPFYSELLGSSLTNARTYDEDGCQWEYLILKGLQLRGYTLDQKPFFLSFDQWWKGINPILNLGLTYDSIFLPGTDGFTHDPLPDLSTWGIVADSSDPIVWTGGIASPFATGTAPISSGGKSDTFTPVGVSYESGQTYKYRVTWTVDGTGVELVPTRLRLQALDVINTILDETTEDHVPESTYITTWEFVAPVGMIKFGIVIEFPSGATLDKLITIESVEDLTEDIPPGDEIETPVLRVEEKSFFYDRVPVVNVPNAKMERSYDENLLIKKIDIGYNDWQSENFSGIDDPQSKRTYATPFKKIGEPMEIKSEFIAASLAIETTRRQKIVQSKDYKFDDKTFIIAINPNDTSPDSYIPELDENFSLITNLLNPETRYNSRITPARNLLRWGNVIFGCLQNYMNSFLKFVGGEGNYDMTSTMIDGCLNEDFSGENLSEKQNIPITDDYLHRAELFTIECALSWDQYLRIRENRTKAIGISQGSSDYAPFFIKTLEYELCKSKAKITAWPVNYFDIQQIEFSKTLVTCSATPSGDCGTDFNDRELSDGDGRETSDGECRVWI